MVISLIMNPSKVSNAPNRSRSAPEQQEQHTNIAVHTEKPSVQPAQVIRFDESMLVAKQKRTHINAPPRRPRQTKPEPHPPDNSDHPAVHEPLHPPPPA